MEKRDPELFHKRSPSSREFIPETSSTVEPANKEKLPGIKECALRLQNATAPQTGPDTENWILRLMWIVAYLGLFVVFVFQTVTLGKKFTSYPTDVSIEIISKPHLQFPAVTLCNNNPVRLSLLERMTEYQDLVYLNDYVRTSVFKFAENAQNGLTVEAAYCNTTSDINWPKLQ